jgi:hypothetical protein
MRAPARVAVTAVLAVLLLGGAGCSTGPLHSIGRHFSARLTLDYCAVTVPTAEQAVHGAGVLVTVQPFDHDDLGAVFGVTPPRVARPRPSPTPGMQARSCLVVVRGSYPAGSVTGAGSESGRYALLLVRVKKPLLLRARVVANFDARQLTVIPVIPVSPVRPG